MRRISTARRLAWPGTASEDTSKLNRRNMPRPFPTGFPLSQTSQLSSTPSKVSVRRWPAYVAGTVKSLRYHQSLRATS